ncbi:MAG: bifunctional oligoribonuclease/PAP phosphatase NrnA [Bacteroidetes bacterium]|nr:bifunctional oligoribonuclease/PAP phosphatase NrnA [Bacteroidota bacterium]
MFQRITPILKKASTFVLTTHVNPDGDGLGSEIALATFLKSIKKKPRIINTSPVPKQYQFLNYGGMIEQYEPSRHDKVINKADVIFVLDISVSKRLDRMQSVILNSPAVRICIDHHLDNDGLAKYNCVDEKAPATAELIYNLIRHLKGKPDLKIATGLYTALITDTGGFRFNATRPSTMRIAADLLEVGIRPNEIYSNVFEQGTYNTMRLLGITLNNMKSECQGAVNWTFLTDEDFKNTKSKRSDTEGFVDYTLRLEKSVLGVFFYETPDGHTKVSLRSKGNVDIQAFAKTYGGGGHKNASGITLRKPFKPTMAAVLRDLKKYFNAKYSK